MRIVRNYLLEQIDRISEQPGLERLAVLEGDDNTLYVVFVLPFQYMAEVIVE
jgi:hypothetical protein